MHPSPTRTAFVFIVCAAALALTHAAPRPLEKSAIHDLHNFSFFDALRAISRWASGAQIPTIPEPSTTKSTARAGEAPGKALKPVEKPALQEESLKQAETEDEPEASAEPMKESAEQAEESVEPAGPEESAKAPVEPAKEPSEQAEESAEPAEDVKMPAKTSGPVQKPENPLEVTTVKEPSGTIEEPLNVPEGPPTMKAKKQPLGKWTDSRVEAAALNKASSQQRS